MKKPEVIIQCSLVSEILPLDDEFVILFGLVIKVHYVSIGCLNINASEVQLNITTHWLLRFGRGAGGALVRD